VALERAAQHARNAGVAIRWVHAGLVEAAPRPATEGFVRRQRSAGSGSPSGNRRARLVTRSPRGVSLRRGPVVRLSGWAGSGVGVEVRGPRSERSRTRTARGWPSGPPSGGGSDTVNRPESPGGCVDYATSGRLKTVHRGRQTFLWWSYPRPRCRPRGERVLGGGHAEVASGGVRDAAGRTARMRQDCSGVRCSATPARLSCSRDGDEHPTIRRSDGSSVSRAANAT